MRRIVLLTLVALSAVVAVPAAEAKGRPLVGLVGSEYAPKLAQFHAGTLRTHYGRVSLAGQPTSWGFSPHNATLVVGADNESCTSGSSTVRFVNLIDMVVLGDVPLVKNGPVTTTAWLDRTHVIAVAAAGDCVKQTKTVVASVDSKRRTVVRSTSLRGDVVKVAQASDRLVLLLGPRGRIGAARLAVVDALGRVRTVSLGGIRAGTVYGSADNPSSKVVHPGLAVDPERGRAFVVPAGDRLAEIDLATLRVTYRETSERRSAFARFRRWLDPPAQAKSVSGPIREALWLGNGRLAVAGVDQSEATRGGVTTRSMLASGLRLVDTRSWKYRKLDDAVSSIRLARGILLATGSSYRYDGTKSEEKHAGLIGYSLDGSELYRAFPETSVFYYSFAGLGFVTVHPVSAFRFYPRTGKAGYAVPAARVWRLLGDEAP